MSSNGNSMGVHSNQLGVHPRLLEALNRHATCPDRTPIRPRDAIAVEQWLDFAARFGSTHIDAGCGTGQSALWLAQRFPTAAVLGIDQSEHRLARGPQTGAANLLLLRAECAGFWRAMAARQARTDRLYLWYPNPWPKSQHLMRRWHGHPVWPTLLACTDHIELRTNWRTYADEFAVALEHAGFGPTSDSPTVDEPVSPFERKYLASGHALHRVSASLKK